MPVSSNNFRNTKSESTNHAEIIQGCIEILQQGQEFLESLSDDHYLYAAPPHVTSTIGEHFRHLLDLFYSLHDAKDVINYNVRRRGHRVETSRQIALAEMQQLAQWLDSINDATLSAPVTLITEVTLSHCSNCEMQSTFGRELVFVALHATHHFAMAKVTVSLCDIAVSETLGFAPATVSYLRGQ